MFLLKSQLWDQWWDHQLEFFLSHHHIRNQRLKIRGYSEFQN